MLKRIHINQHVIRRNAKTGEREPVITCKTYKSNDYAHEVEIDGPCKIIYSPDKPLSCGAKVWIETTAPIRTWRTNRVELKENDYII
jgi:hypothetical protein